MLVLSHVKMVAVLSGCPLPVEKRGGKKGVGRVKQS
jgi:hypothetical protein